MLVIEKLGLKAANNIDWSMPRVVCVAGDFTKYDESAIKQMNRNISLIRYKKFGEDLLMFEQVNENVVSAIPDNEPVSKAKATDKTFDEQIRNCLLYTSPPCCVKLLAAAKITPQVSNTASGLVLFLTAGEVEVMQTWIVDAIKINDIFLTGWVLFRCV